MGTSISPCKQVRLKAGQAAQRPAKPGRKSAGGGGGGSGEESVMVIDGGGGGTAAAAAAAAVEGASGLEGDEVGLCHVIHHVANPRSLLSVNDFACRGEAVHVIQHIANPRS